MAESAYDVFISYSHAADDQLAPALHQALQRFAKPWWRRRSLRVFLDQHALSANPGLWSSITAALDKSGWFVLLASPEAAQSPWVSKELEYWKSHKDPGRILPVVTDGTWAWDGADFAAAATAVPLALAGVYREEPRHVDMRWARTEAHVDVRNGRFLDQVAEIAAPVHGMEKDDLIGVDVRHHRRTLRTAWAAAVTLVVLLLVSSGAALAAVNSAHEADQQRHQAQTNALTAERNAKEAADNSATAKRNEDSARAAQAEADANAQSAADNAAQAEANADEATANANEAQANAEQATANANEAQANAEQARLAQLVADQNAADALVQQAAARAAEAAAEKANALTQVANQHLDATNQDLDGANHDLDAANQDLEAQKSALAKSNEDLLTANGDLDSARLVALSDTERVAGNLDTAMLLANEAIDAATTNKAPARNHALALQEEAPYLDRYLPGPGITPGSVRVESGRIAALTSDGRSVLIWRLDTPNADPVRVEGFGTAGSWTAFAGSGVFSGDGHRFILLADDARIRIWDTDAGGVPLFTSAPTGGTIGPFPSTIHVQISPDHTTLALQVAQGSTTAVVLVDVGDGRSVATWAGTRLAWGSGCQLDFVTLASCGFSHNSRHLLTESDHGTFVLRDIDHPAVAVELYAPTGFLHNLLVLPALLDDGRTVAAPDPSTLQVLSATGSVEASLTVDGDVLATTASADGTLVFAVTASGEVLRLDSVTSTIAPVASLGDNLCPLPPELQTPPSLSLSPQSDWLFVGEGGCGPSSYVPTRADPALLGPFQWPADPVAFLDRAPLGVAGPESLIVTSDGLVHDRSTGFAEPIGADIDGGCLSAPTGNRLVCGHTLYSFDDPFDPFAFPLVTDLGSSFLGGHFDNTGRKIVGESASGRIWIVDTDRESVATTVLAREFADYGGSLLSGDGSTLAVISVLDTSVIPPVGKAAIFRSAGGEPVNITLQLDGLPENLRISRDGRWGLVEQREVFSGRPLPAIVLDTGTGGVVGRVKGHAVFSGDGSTIATWDDASGGPLEVSIVSTTDLAVSYSFKLPAGDQAEAAVLTGDGTRLATIASSGRAIVTDTLTGATVDAVDFTPSPHGGFPMLALSNDGRRLAVIVFERFDPNGHAVFNVTVFDLGSNELVSQSPSVKAGFCRSASYTPSFSPDGTLLYVAGRLFDGTSLVPIGSQPLGCEEAGFGSDGSTLNYLLRPGSPTAPLQWMEVALNPMALRAANCVEAGRNLSLAEWKRFEPAVPYRRTCDQWPHGS